MSKENMSHKRIYPIYHKGKEILYTDWTYMKTVESAIQIMNETSDFVVNQEQRDLLEIINSEGTYATTEILFHLKEINEKVKGFSKKKAVIGLTLSKRVFLNTLNIFSGTNIKVFENIEEAKDWLVKE